MEEDDFDVLTDGRCCGNGGQLNPCKNSQIAVSFSVSTTASFAKPNLQGGVRFTAEADTREFRTPLW
jgi:hypothetical protein